MKLGMSCLRLSAVALCAACPPQTKTYAQKAPIEKYSSGVEEEAASEAQIRRRVEEYAKAIRARDIEGVMSLYAPNIVSFDVDPPLRYAGTDNKRRAWQAFFGAHTGPITYDVRELKVTAQAELAFAHSLNHVNGRLASGHIADLWVRWTACLKRVDGVWLVVHDHVSVPADLKNGQALLNLTP